MSNNEKMADINKTIKEICGPLVDGAREELEKFKESRKSNAASPLIIANELMTIAVGVCSNFSSNILAGIYVGQGIENLKVKQKILSEFVHRFDDYFERCIIQFQEEYKENKNA